MSEAPRYELGPVLQALDDIEPAPLDMVERTWVELDEFLRPDGEHPQMLVVKPVGSHEPRRRMPLLLVAAAVAALITGLLFKTGSNDRELVPAVTTATIKVPPTIGSSPIIESSPTVLPGVPTTAEACSVFRGEVPDMSDVRDVIASGDEAAADTLVEVDAALAALIDALAAGAAPAGAVTDLRLARGALDDAAAALVADDLTSATESFEVAIERLRLTMAEHEPPIDGCITI